MHTISKTENRTIAGFYDLSKNIVKTAKFDNKSWQFNDEEDQILSQEIPKPIDLSQAISINAVLQRLPNQDKDFENYNKIIASLAFNQELDSLIWNILSILNNHQIKNLKVNGNNGEIISCNKVNLIRRL